MTSENRIRLYVNALTWALNRGAKGKLNSQGHPYYYKYEKGGEQTFLTPDKSIASTLNACVFTDRMNHVETLSSPEPMAPTEREVFQAHAKLQAKVIRQLSESVEKGHKRTNERNAYQNMLIRFLVMRQAKNEVGHAVWEEFATTVGDVLIHWSKDKDDT